MVRRACTKPPPPLCESNALVRATAGVVALLLEPLNFGGSFLWLSKKTVFL